MTLVQGSFSGASPSIHPRHPWGQQSRQQTSSFPRGNWWPYPWIPPIFVLWPHTSGSRTMSDEIFRLLPILILPVSHYKLLHSENGNRLRWRWREGLTEVGEKREGQKGRGSGGVCIDNQSPKKNTWGKNDSGDPDKESHLSEHIDLIYKTSTLMRNKWRGRGLVLNHKTPALLRLRWNTTYIPHRGLMCCFTARYDWGWPNSLFDN